MSRTCVTDHCDEIARPTQGLRQRKQGDAPVNGSVFGYLSLCSCFRPDAISSLAGPAADRSDVGGILSAGALSQRDCNRARYLPVSPVAVSIAFAALETSHELDSETLIVPRFSAGYPVLELLVRGDRSDAHDSGTRQRAFLHNPLEQPPRQQQDDGKENRDPSARKPRIPLRSVDRDVGSISRHAEQEAKEQFCGERHEEP
jgi:hypothetical protein